MNRTASASIVLLLAVIGVAATYVLYRSSAAQIASEQRLIESRKLLDLLPLDAYDNQPLEQPLALADLNLSHSTLTGGYRATEHGQTVAILLHSQTQGYAGAIELLIAIDANGKLLGVKTLKQSETPGLGGHLGTGRIPGYSRLSAHRARSRQMRDGR